MNRKKFVLLILLFVSLYNSISAQKGLVSSGGDILTSSGSINYSVGQVAYQYLGNTSAVIEEGLQHPYEIYQVGIGSLYDDFISLAPNPTQDYVVLDVQEIPLANMSYSLYTLDGKMVQAATIVDDKTVIELNTYHSSIFILRVLNNDKSIKIFKIIKI